MSLIVAARFQTFDQATHAAKQLSAQGIADDDIQMFYVNTAGSHDRYPLGGDRVADPDAKGGHLGAMAGASIFGLVFAILGGLLAAWLGFSVWLVIAAAGVGAYLGALAGALRIIGRGKKPAATAARAPDVHPAVRQAGVMLALHVVPPQDEIARKILREAGGQDVERAQGRWVNGEWEDFDPLAAPQYVDRPPTPAQTGAAPR